MAEMEVPPQRKGAWRIAVVVLLGMAAASYGLYYYFHSLAYQSTEDASLEAHVVQIAPRVAGSVTSIEVQENQQVRKGQLLFQLDPADYQLRLDQARANLLSVEQRLKSQQARVSLTRTNTQATLQGAHSQADLAQASIAQAQAGLQTAREQQESSRLRAQQARLGIETQRRNVAQATDQAHAAQAEYQRLQKDLVRYQNLYHLLAVSRQQLDTVQAQTRSAEAQYAAALNRIRVLSSQVEEAQTAYRTALQSVDQGASSIDEAQARVQEARAHLGDMLSKVDAAQSGGTQVAISQAEASTTEADRLTARQAVRVAQQNLSYCKIYAPQDGRVARRSIEIGTYMQTGQPAMAIVSNEIWVVANFKETQLTRMRPGQKAVVRADVIRGRSLAAHIDSFQPGTGARFSVLPPENASGNWVKVVQRLPVKVVFEQQPDASLPLAPGMSVEVEVQTR